MSNGQNQFAFARMTPAEYRDDCQQGRLPLKPTVDNGSFRVVACPSCGGSTFDDGERPLVCHCGATIPEEGPDMRARVVGE